MTLSDNYDIRDLDQLELLARQVVEGGNKLRQMQTGQIQQYIGSAVAAFFVILAAVVLLV